MLSERGYMRILQVADEPWDSGITSLALELSLGLRDKGHEVLFAGLDGKNPVMQAREKGLNTLGLRSKMSLIALRRAVLDNDIDIINCHTGSSHFISWLLLKTINKRHIPLIRTRGDIRPPNVHKFLYGSTSYVICASEVIRRAFLKGGKIQEEKLTTIYPGVDIEAFSPRAEMENKDLITIVGRLDPVKGHRFFLEGISLVKRERGDIKAQIVGEEKNVGLSELRGLAKSLGIEKDVEFKNSREDIPQVMRKAHIGVICSIGSEAVSRVALEWMACGKPVVAFRVGCIPEIIEDGENGFLVEPKNTAKLKERIVYLLDNQDLCRDMGRAARQSILEGFSREVFVNKTEEVYRRALERQIKDFFDARC